MKRRLTLVATTLFALASFGLAVYAHALNAAVYETGVIIPAKTTLAAKAAGNESTAQNKANGATKGAQTTVQNTLTGTNAVPLCTPNTTASPAVAPSVSAANPGLVVAPSSTSYYTVYGNQLAEIGNQINRCSPVREDSEVFSASTASSFSWAVDYMYRADGMCIVTRASVGLGVHLTYPDWQPTSGVAANVRADWQRFMNNLVIHENGHVALARSTAGTMLSHLQNFPPTSCANLNTAIQAQVQADIAALNGSNEHYDEETGHGTSQGAIL